MSVLKVRDAGAWVTEFTPKHYLTAAWQSDILQVKAYVGTEWVTFWPPGASGATSILVTMSSVSNPLNVLAFKFGGGDADAEVLFTLGGDVQKKINLGAASDVGDWISDKTGIDGSLYEIQATVTSGAVSAGSDSTGTYLGLGVDRAWNVNQVGGGNGVEAATLDIIIREILDTGNTATLTVELEASTEL